MVDIINLIKQNNAAASAVKQSNAIDARPIIERNTTNIISRMELVRDKLYDQFFQVCKEKNIEALLIKSHPFSASVWFKFECWLPQQANKYHVTHRVSATIYIASKEFHRYEYEMSLVLKKGIKVKTYPSIVEFDIANARAIVSYLLDQNSNTTANFWMKRCRTYQYQLWLSKNKMVGLKKDDLQLIPSCFFIMGVLLVPVTGLFALAAFAVGGGILFYLKNRAVYTITSGKPSQEPRRLILMDSWQTLIYDLGKETNNLKLEVKKELEKAAQEGINLYGEKIWYWGVDGKEEREQLVVIFRRGICFVHVYQYGNDLYIAWDAHVNAGTWVEQEVAMGIDPQTKSLAKVNTIVAGWSNPNEYDLTDTNCLVEWVHAAVTKVVKKMVANYKIDQEIDFHILRGERQGIIGREDPAGKKNILSPFKVNRES